MDIEKKHEEYTRGIAPPPRPEGSTSVAEYLVYVDTRHRNFTTHPNPFQFTLEFDPLKDSPSLCVPLSVRDVYLLRFRSIMLPLRLIPSPSERFFYLRIKEVDAMFRYYTDPTMNPGTDLLLYNVGSGGPNLYLECREEIRYPLGARSRLQRLTMEFLDSKGQKIIPPSNANSLDMSKWILVFPDLFPEGDDRRAIVTTYPEFDPKHAINNIFMEVQITASR